MTVRRCFGGFTPIGSDLAGSLRITNGTTAALALLAVLPGWSGALWAKDARPNVLLVISDDQSWVHAGAYGQKGLRTPAFDRVAREGVLFMQAFSSSPMCTVSRACLLTGRNAWQNREAGTHFSTFPRDLPVYPSLLKEAGYQTGYTGKGWSPGDWKASGWPNNPAGPDFNEIKNEVPTTGIFPVDYAANFEKFLAQRDPDKPFCFWFGAKEPHEPVERGSGKRLGFDPAQVELPPFMADTPANREELADIFAEIEWFDRHLAQMLERLEKAGLLENTLIVVVGDNGTAIPHAKANLYEYGVHVPMAARWGDRIRPGRRVEDLVAFVDLAPTFLEVAGLKPHPEMAGRSLLPILLADASGWVDATRKEVFLCQERSNHARFDNLGYPMRAIRTDRHLLIRNMKPDRWPVGDPPEAQRGRPVDESKQSPDARKRPPVELFDIVADPACLHNLAGDPAQREVAARLDARLLEVMRQQGDPRALGYGDVWESYPRYGPMRTDLGGFAERGAYNPQYAVKPPDKK